MKDLARSYLFPVTIWKTSYFSCAISRTFLSGRSSLTSLKTFLISVADKEQKALFVSLVKAVDGGVLRRKVPDKRVVAVPVAAEADLEIEQLLDNADISLELRHL